MLRHSALVRLLRGGVKHCHFCDVVVANKTSGPLAGIRILDLSRVLAGPYCTQILGDMGAEVIKIEAPCGDDTRAWGPPFKQGESAYFMSINRNKASVVIDLKRKEGIALIEKLSLKCDVVIENFLPGKAEELGIGYSQLSTLNPSIIYCSISGYGATGPKSQRPGYDAIISAMYGMLHITGTEDGVAVKPGVAITDVLTGLLAHGAILAALHERQRSGLGQHITTSLMEGQLSSLVNIAGSYMLTGEDKSKKYGTAHPNIVPYQTFTCADNKDIYIAAGNIRQLKILCSKIDRPELSTDERFNSNEARVANRAELIALLQAALSKQPLQYWLDVFGEELPHGPVRNIEESFSDPQAIARDMVQTVQHSAFGELRVVGPPVKYSRTPCTIRLPPPVLGEHTKRILVDILELNDEEFRKLVDERIVYDANIV